MSDQTTDHVTTAPEERAALARSILSCPAAVDLTVDGVPGVLDGVGGLGMQDVDGTPVFSCDPDSALARAAALRCKALLTVRSGLGDARDPGRAHGRGDERSGRLTLAGRLVVQRREECGCCSEVRDVVSLELDLVMLPGAVPVPLVSYHSPVHQLNDGFLQRSVEHANDCHQDDLRQAVAQATRTPVPEVGGVGLAGLTPRGVRVGWVTADGAHVLDLTFPRPARSAAELGDHLRRQLARGLCA